MTQGADHVRGLDGVRGIMTAIVIMTHMHLIGIGWVTMQVFFVMSGFLITRILLNLREREDLGGYLKIFYARRTLRIFPAYYLFLLILTALSYVLPNMALERSQMPWAALYVWNWFAVSHPGETAQQLEHFWSLAVEEQFYIAWPLLVFFVRGRAFWWTAAALVAAGPALRWASAVLWLDPGDTDVAIGAAVYQMSTTHLDAFALGALLVAAVKQPWSARFKPWHLLAAIAVVYALGALLNGPGLGKGGPYRVPLNFGYPIHMGEHWQFIWGYSVMNFLGAGLLLLVAQGRFLNRLFDHPLPRRMGLISYATYIIHLPMLYLAVPLLHRWQALFESRYVATLLFAVAFITVLFVIAEFSFRYFESRFLLMKDTWFSGKRSPSHAKSVTTTTVANDPAAPGAP